MAAHDGDGLRTYDLAVLGAGQAGVPLSLKLAKRGWKVAIIERERVGGSCVNFGCTPTKAALESAHLAARARRGAEFGLRIPTVEVDFPAVLARAHAIAEESRQHIVAALEKSDADLIRGHGRLAGRVGELFKIDVEGGPSILAEKVVLDTGTRARVPDIDGLSEVDDLNGGNWLGQTALARRLAIIGAGYIGMEAGQGYQRLGSEVTIIDRRPEVLGKEDPEIAAAARKLLEGEGLRFVMDAAIERVEKTEAGVSVHLGGGEVIEADRLYVAVGRQPNTGDLGLETVGIEPTDKGIIPVDDHLKTSARGIWAVGDIRGGPMFTHNAHDDHHVLMAQLCGSDPASDGSIAGRIVPWAVFTDPPIGRVGMTEAEARKAGHKLKIARMSAEKSDRHREAGERAGLLKLVVDAETDKVLGAACLCHAGPEIVHAFVGLMNADLPVSEILRSIYIHPTFMEAARSLVFALRDDPSDSGC